VSGGYVRLEAGTPGLRNSWRPTAHCRLDPDSAGSRLTGRLRTPVPVLLPMTIWLSLAVVFFLVALASTVVTLAIGDFHDAGTAATVTGVGTIVAVVGGALIGAGNAFGRKDADFLLGWLADRLEDTGSGAR
jgi:hypothetical protein